MDFQEMCFTTSTERLLLAEYFYEWQYKHEIEQELKEWYAKFCGVDEANGSDITLLMFMAFAGGVRYGQQLAQDLIHLDRASEAKSE